MAVASKALKARHTTRYKTQNVGVGEEKIWKMKTGVFSLRYRVI
jgi:hypothetical protein